MLGLAAYANVTDTLLHSALPTAGLPRSVPHRTYLGAVANLSVSEPDPIIEDTPDPPDEFEIDYTVQPPEVGQNIEVDETGSELVNITPSKQKRVLCSFSSQELADFSDPDEYPFDAVTYTESPNYLGLPYNDHTYISASKSPRSTPKSVDENRLCLLANLAVANAELPLEQAGSHVQTHGSSFEVNNDTFPRGFLKSSSDSPCTTLPHTSCGTEATLSTSNNSLITASPVNTTISLHPSVSSSTSGATPPLQVHRVSSSLTPHIILRTGVPGLQISTTAARHGPGIPDTDGVFRCSCGRTRIDGRVIQCESCRDWQHVDCISPSKSPRLGTPYVCKNCYPSSTQVASTVVFQRQKLTAIPVNNSNIWVSHGASSSPSPSLGRVLIADVNPNPSTVRQLCVSSASPAPSAPQILRADVNTLSAINTSGSLQNVPRCFSLTPRPSSLSQPTRASKRKQDLITLTTPSFVDGLGGVASKPSTVDEVGAKTQINSLDGTEFGEIGVVETAGNVLLDSSDKPAATSLHRLLIYDTENANKCVLAHEPDIKRSSPPSLAFSSDTLISSTAAYEEATNLRLTERFFRKLENLMSTTSQENTVNGFCKEETAPKLPPYKRYQVNSFDFNRKGLIASAAIYPREPVIEYHGLCMLLSEYNEMYDYRKHYNPYVLFYKSWADLPLCVDARKYGNEARFMRRSCTPNCEVRHFVSTVDDPLSGRVPRIRLVVFAIRPIPRSTELTLPFDFDYTTCRYLVRCACARKACPVERWFRQTNPSDTDFSDTGAVHCRSLPLTRKSQLHSRGLSSRPRGPPFVGKDNYSDILTDECELGDGDGDLSWMDNDDSPMSRLQPRKTFKRGSRGRIQVSTNETFDKHTTVRVRGRGRRPGGNLNRNARVGMIVKTTGSNRGRPPGVRSIKRHSVQCKRQIHSKSVKLKHAYVDNMDYPNVEPVTGNHKLGVQRSGKRFSRATLGERRSSGRYSTSLSEKESYFSSDHSPSPCHSPSAEMQNSVLSTPDNPVDEPNHLPEEQMKINGVKEEKYSPLGERPRKRKKATREESNSSSRKEVNRKKSREEIWMAEVLRRIERMEKKQKHKRAVSDKAENRLRDKKSSATKPETLEDTLPSNSGDTNKTTETKITNHPETATNESEELSDFKSSISSLPDCEPNSTTERNDPPITPSTDASPKNDLSPVPSKKENNLSEPSNDEVIAHPKNSRRRSQVRSFTSNEPHETREERWLKSQLRRIAELEKCSSRKLFSPKPSTDGPCTSVGEQVTGSVNSNGVSFSGDSLRDTSLNGIDHLAPSDMFDNQQPRRRFQSTSTLLSQPSNQSHKHFAVRRKSDIIHHNHISDSVGVHTIPPKSNDAYNAEADCELIVYRTCEKDPMAKFSRDRSIHSTPAIPHDIFSQENTPPVHGSPDLAKVTSSYCTPKPTKKRWLSQALLEEDTDSIVEPCKPADRVAEQPMSANEAASTQLPTPIISPIACAVNPKKRLISQFSELHSNENSFLFSTREPEKKQELISTTPKSGPDETRSLTPPNEDFGSQNSVASHSTPLPPKETTVKEQTEEMRKVKVSLSEYRRRRGLSSGSAPTPVNKPTRDDDVTPDPLTGRFDQLNHELLSPNRLLDEIPKIYQQLQLPTCFLTKPGNSTPLLPTPTVDHEPGDNILPTSRPDYLPTDNAFLERGPRTPSEPPDDDDVDQTCYVRRPVLTSIAEEAEHAAVRTPSPEYQDASYDSRRRPWNSFAEDETIYPINHSLQSNDDVELGSRHWRYSDDDQDHRWVKRHSADDDDRFHATSAVPNGFSSKSVHTERAESSDPVISPAFTRSFNPKNNLDNQEFKRTHRRYSGSDAQVDASNRTNSLDYFIKRDQAIRHWQQSHSLDRDRSLSKSHSTHRHRENRQSSHTVSGRLNRSDSNGRSAHSSSSRVADLEETLCRLQECLRSQIDRTRIALTTHGGHQYDRPKFTQIDPDSEMVNAESFSGHNKTGRYTPYGDERISHRSYLT